MEHAITRKAGGPATTQGKARSRRNAVKHGGRASTLIRNIVGEDAFDALHAALCEQLKPVGPIESLLVEQMAQAAAAARITALQLRAAVRDAAQALEQVNGIEDYSGRDTDAVLRATAETPAYALATRYHGSAISGFQRLLKQLREVQASRALLVPARVPVAGQRAERLASLIGVLKDDAERRNFLARAFLHFGLTRSGDVRARPIDARVKETDLTKALEQTFLTKAGVSEQQALGFVAYFLTDPEAPVAAISRRAGIRRRQTYLKLHSLIRRSGDETASRDWVLKGLEAYLDGEL